MADASRSIGKFVASIKAQLEKDRDPIAQAMAVEAARLVQSRTRSGKGVATDGGSSYPLKPLSPAYIAQRRHSRLSSFTSATKSNLTRTNQMLGSLKAKKKSAGAWSIVIDGTRDDGKTNAQIAKYVSRQRPFMFFAGDEIAKIQNIGRRTFAALVKSSK